MTLHEKSLVITLDSFFSEYSYPDKKRSLEKSIVLSKMRVLNSIFKDKICLNFNLFDYLKSTCSCNQIYIFLFYQFLYALNLKKNFTSRNTNRIISNYFSILINSVQRKVNLLTIPQEIIEDKEYITTFALSNLYTINEFYNEIQNS
jgi:hypothetical protein